MLFSLFVCICLNIMPYHKLIIDFHLQLLTLSTTELKTKKMKLKLTCQSASFQLASSSIFLEKIETKYRWLNYSSRDLLLNAKSNIYSACVHNLLLYGSEAWTVKEVNVIRLDRNDAKMFKWMWNIRSDDRISNLIKSRSHVNTVVNIYRIEDYYDLAIQRE